ncbi:MAG: UDP-3-O-acyl-N-acetylglucosamine deacetylase [Candidatus Omnitrophica bacterium]|nr:UDP-3-O-acyl-N-acetylglucosamine deacetylase [Candidatus Omnitrophota bacterium]
MKQRTLKNQVVFEGAGLHTGRKVTVCVRPASENAGILFCRVDLAPDLKVRASIENVCSDEMRQTAIRVGELFTGSGSITRWWRSTGKKFPGWMEVLWNSRRA